jgi:hypothetical protein
VVLMHANADADRHLLRSERQAVRAPSGTDFDENASGIADEMFALIGT